MKLLCWYPVGDYGFDLYFLAFTDDEPPDPNLEGVANREWTYSRPYTTLELQVAGRGGRHTVASPGAIGWQGMVIGVTSLDAATSHFADAGINTLAGSPG